MFKVTVFSLGHMSHLADSYLILIGFFFSATLTIIPNSPSVLLSYSAPLASREGTSLYSPFPH